MRADVLADHVGEVLEGLVAGLVAVGVVDQLEVVHVEQAQAQGRAAPLGKGGFAAEGLVEALAVEHAGEGVVADEFAGLFELGLQAGDLGVGVVGLVAEFFDLAAGALGGFLHRAGFAHHVGDHVGELGDVAGGGDAPGGLLDPGVVVAR